MSRDPIGEKGGGNLLCFIRNCPDTALDYLGLRKACCICAIDPGNCRIDLSWTSATRELKYQPTDPNRPGYLGDFGVGVKAVVTHSAGGDVSGCHLHQGAELRDDSDSPPNDDIVLPDDYGSAKPNPGFYGGWWLTDDPHNADVSRTRPVSPQTYWFQAHDYVEEAPSVQTWWGFAGTATWNASSIPKKGYMRWKGTPRGWFSVQLGVDEL